MKESSKELAIKNAMSHIRDLHAHARQVMEERELRSFQTSLYIDDNLDTFDLNYDTAPTPYLRGDKIMARGANIAMKLFGHDETFGHRAYFHYTPLDGDIVDTVFLNHVVKRLSVPRNAFNVSFYEKPRLEPGHPDARVAGHTVLNRQNGSLLGDPIEAPDSVDSILDKLQNIRTDHLYIPVDEHLSPELNETLMKRGKKSLDTIFSAHVGTSEDQTVVFLLGHEKPIEVHVRPYEEGGVMEMVIDIDGSRTYFSYDIALGGRQGVLAYISDYTGALIQHNKAIYSPSVLKPLDEILQSLAIHAAGGVVRDSSASMDVLSNELEKAFYPRVELASGFDLRAMITSLHSDL